jgi:hypothetical protein
MSWSGGGSLNFDFFGFAALATLVLFLVRRAARPVAVAWLLLAAVLFMRFGLAPFARGHVAPNTLAAFITGIAPCWFVSYPIGPWLAFPLLGFLLCRRWPVGSSGERRLVGCVAIVTLAAAVLMAHRGAPVFRWASVSLAYFFCAVGIIAVAWLVMEWLARRGAGAAGALALRGPSSLLIVPLHYGILGALRALWPAPLDVATWVAVVALLVCGVLLLSRSLVDWMGRRSRASASLQVAVFAGTLAVAGTTYVVGSPLWRLEVCSLGEVVMGLLLLWSNKRPVSRALADTRLESPGLR